MNWRMFNVLDEHQEQVRVQGRVQGRGGEGCSACRVLCVAACVPHVCRIGAARMDRVLL